MTTTLGYPDWDARRSKDLADFLKALRDRLHQALPASLSFSPTGTSVFPGGALEPATEMTGYVLAWRQWRIVSDPGGTLRLASLNEAIWPPRARLVAACLAGHWQPHPPPDPLCSCGIYALKEAGLLTAFGPGFLFGALAAFGGVQTPTRRARVRRQGSNELVSWTVGKVALWGRVLEYTGGFRAQYGYPYVLWSVSLTKDERIALGDAYGVEVYQLDGDVLKTIAHEGHEFVD